MLQEIGSTIVAEFSDIPDLATLTQITVRLFVAAILGGLLGMERERKSKSAGTRTHMLVAVGAALFMIGPTLAGMSLGDLSRVIQGTIQGIGFLGAGAIIISTAMGRVQGLTTAASIWATAGIGIAAGLGMEATAVLSTAIVLFVLAIVPRFASRNQDAPAETPGQNEAPPSS
ncbi:MAG: MgtC/SapB family protein [Woeseia sp.]